ncbi:Disease resistance protein [Nymphaea thermarum]|nr:Disease resistance protein [Nymphaea thermarum]
MSIWYSKKPAPNVRSLIGYYIECSILSAYRLLTGKHNHGMHTFETLKVLNLSGCNHFVTSPDLSNLLSLIKLTFDYSLNLMEVHDSIGNLRSLVYFSMRGCESLEALPNSFVQLNSLKVLILSGCSKLSTLPEQLGCMRSLIEVALDQTAIRMIPNSIGHLTRLSRLSLVYCDSLVSLPDSIGELCSLTELMLDNSAVHGIPGSVGSLKKLRRLGASNCSNLASIPDSFGSVENLEMLRITGSGKFNILPLSFAQSRNLFYLNLSYLGISELPENFGSLNKLRLLYLNGNNKLVMLPSTFCQLSSLERLDLKECSLSDSGISLDFSMLLSLKVLNLDGNKFSCLPTTLSSLPQLEELSLLACAKLQSLPPLPSSVTKLDAYRCSSLERIPNISNLKSLSVLDFTDCKSLEDVPGLETLTCLMCLHLAGCTNLSSKFKKRIVKGSSGLVRGLGAKQVGWVMTQSSFSSDNAPPTQLDRQTKERTEKMMRSSEPWPYVESSPPVSDERLEFVAHVSFRRKESSKRQQRFTNLLYAAFARECIKFSGEHGEEEEGGDQEVGKVVAAVERSEVFVPIFSRSFAESSRCLMEVEKMVECKRRILPIFFDVDPSDVRRQRGPFEQPFADHEKRFSKEKVKAWRDALGETGEISGHDLRNAPQGAVHGIPRSVGSLKKLKRLGASNCSNLASIPDSFGSVPLSFAQSRNLFYLKLSNLGIGELAENFGSLNKLKFLYLDGNNKLVTLPSTFCQLSSLERLDLQECSLSDSGISLDFSMLLSLKILNLDGNKFSCLPTTLSSLPQLEELSLLTCAKLQSLPPLPSSITKLDAYRCSSLERIPNISNLKSLRVLDFTDCKSLEDVPGLETLTCLMCLHLVGCTNLSSNFKKRIVKETFQHLESLSIPGNKCPSWFKHQQLCCEVQKPSVGNHEIKGLLLWVVFCMIKT